MKKLAAILLVLCMALTLCACSNANLESIVGTWELKEEATSDDIEALLEFYDFYEEEMACIDTTGLCLTRLFIFDEEGNFTDRYDAASSCADFRAYMIAAVEALYDNLETLAPLYGEEILTECTSVDDFKDFYCYVYDYDTFDEMIDDFTDEFEEMMCFDTEDVYTGTVEVESDYITFHYDDTEREDGCVGYSVSGDKLTIEYSDVTDVYTRIG